ncbi:MAG: hypothetical protein QOE45_2382 [Frankiaceae bacterium]|jgi:uncharacterized protein (TIGR03083 family)|nr:hypothetical protein [Frankiaceae bacterium]
MDERFAGEWPDHRALVRVELDAYAAAGVDGDLPTRCVPWTVTDVTRHLAATFERFVAMLEQGRRGNFSPPFPREALDTENLRAVEQFTGDPDARLRAAAETFLDLATDPDEPMPHQLGVVPVGVQTLFGLADLAIHHDDVARAAGGAYQPAPEVVETLVAAYRRLGFWEESDPPVWASLVADRES